MLFKFSIAAILASAAICKKSPCTPPYSFCVNFDDCCEGYHCSQYYFCESDEHPVMKQEENTCAALGDPCNSDDDCCQKGAGGSHYAECNFYFMLGSRCEVKCLNKGEWCIDDDDCCGD